MHLMYLTLPDGEKVYVNPRHVISVRAGTCTDSKARVTLTEGRFYEVTQTPEQVKDQFKYAMEGLN